jgi:glyoxylase-like metal-dependent hydrolase (beta-lactamase superfamily II)
MSTGVVLLTAVLVLAPFTAQAQDARATVEAAAKALGATDVRSIEIQGAGTFFWAGQSQTPGMAWPQFTVRSFTRLVNYETASLRDEMVRTRTLEPPRGGGPYVRGEHTAVSVVRAAMANPAGSQGRAIAFSVPGQFKATAFLDAASLIERVEATMASPVLGDMAVTVSYADYRDFGGVKFPTKIRQTYGGFPALELTITEVRPNVAADITVPDNVRQAGNPYTRVQSQKAAEGVWYLTGGSHHSVVIEMKDHLIVAEGPLNDDRALAVIAEARTLVPGKPIKYLVVSHHHFDHSGGVRAFAGEGATIVTHDVSRPYFERILASPATVGPDHLAKSGKKATVEGVRDRRVLTDGTRTVEVRHIAGILHADDMLMVYLPKEKLLVQADAYTPPAPNMAPMSPPSPFNVSLLENITKQGLAVDQLLPLHGRIVPLSELQKAAGHSH